MSALLKIFGGSYQLYFVAFLLMALGVATSCFFFERGQVIEYRDKVAVLNTDLVSAKDALQVNARAVSDLQAGLALWQGKANAAEAAQAAAEDRLAQELVARTTRAATLKVTEKADDARPDCTKLLAMDLGAICPGHLAALRVRAADAAGVPGPSHQGTGPDARSP